MVCREPKIVENANLIKGLLFVRAKTIAVEIFPKEFNNL